MLIFGMQVVDFGSQQIAVQGAPAVSTTTGENP